MQQLQSSRQQYNDVDAGAVQQRYSSIWEEEGMGGNDGGPAASEQASTTSTSTGRTREISDEWKMGLLRE